MRRLLRLTAIIFAQILLCAEAPHVYGGVYYNKYASSLGSVLSPRLSINIPSMRADFLTALSKQNFDDFLNGFKIKAVREYLAELTGYMYGAYGISQNDVNRMLEIIARAKTSRQAIEDVYSAGMQWDDPDNKFGATYRRYKTSIQPDIRSELVRQFVKGEVVLDIGTGNMSMLHKVIGPLDTVRL